MIKTVIKGYSLQELEEWAESIGEKPFRGRQIFQWMYQKGRRDFREMTNLPQKLIPRLEDSVSLSAIEPEEFRHSKLEETQKALFRLRDGLEIESVYMRDEKRVTVCLSTQAGCRMGCVFCATGKMGFKRNLSCGEIIDQFLYLRDMAPHPITNVVFMGMGEPFLNYREVISAAYILNNELGPGLAARHITISTVGIPRFIRQYAKEGHKFKLAISLNAPDNKLRSLLMPVSKKLSLAEVLSAARYYSKKSGKRVTFEYVLIPEYNDTFEHALQLIELLRNIPCKLNIIPYNSINDGIFRAPGEEEINRFVEVLYNAPFAVTIRRSRGKDINAACGQLASERV